MADEPNKTQADDFAKEAEGESPGVLREFWDFLRFNKKWWLTPIIIVLLLMIVFVMIGAGGGAATPFIYTLF